MAACIYCGAQISDTAVFCEKCGRKQVKVYSVTFTRRSIPEEQFLNDINRWFAENPYAVNLKCKFHTDSCLGAFVNKVVLNSFSVEYEKSREKNPNQYAITQVKSLDLYARKPVEIFNEWKKAHPNTILLDQHTMHNMRGHCTSLAFGGIGATNLTQMYLLYSFPRESGTGAQRTTRHRNFCVHCGTKLEDNACFCMQCGKRIHTETA